MARSKVSTTKKVVACKACYRPLEPNDVVCCARCSKLPIGKRYIAEATKQESKPAPPIKRPLKKAKPPQATPRPPKPPPKPRQPKTETEKKLTAKERHRRYTTKEFQYGKPLTDKERKILRLLWIEQTATRVSIVTGMSYQMVLWHVRIIKLKLGVEKPKDAVELALRKGLIAYE